VGERRRDGHHDHRIDGDQQADGGERDVQAGGELGQQTDGQVLTGDEAEGGTTQRSERSQGGRGVPGGEGVVLSRERRCASPRRWW
jgi:hypothetical protein